MNTNLPEIMTSCWSNISIPPEWIHHISFFQIWLREDQKNLKYHWVKKVQPLGWTVVSVIRKFIWPVNRHLSRRLSLPVSSAEQLGPELCRVKMPQKPQASFMGLANRWCTYTADFWEHLWVKMGQNLRRRLSWRCMGKRNNACKTQRQQAIAMTGH